MPVFKARLDKLLLHFRRQESCLIESVLRIRRAEVERELENAKETRPVSVAVIFTLFFLLFLFFFSFCM